MKAFTSPLNLASQRFLLTSSACADWRTVSDIILNKLLYCSFSSLNGIFRATSVGNYSCIQLSNGLARYNY